MNEPLKENKMDISLEEIRNCILLLETLTENLQLLTSLPEKERIALMVVAGKISRPDRNEIRIRNKTIKHSKRKKSSFKKDKRGRRPEFDWLERLQYLKPLFKFRIKPIFGKTKMHLNFLLHVTVMCVKRNILVFIFL